jgi:hypothetical protein
MQIILLHPALRHVRSVTLTSRHYMLAAAAFLVLLLLSTSLLTWLLVRHAAELNVPWLPQVAQPQARDDAERQQRYVKENLAAMAIKLGEMQAQLMRLDALGERVQGLAGIKPEEFNFHQLPGRGGAERSALQDSAAKDWNVAQFQAALDAFAQVAHAAHDPAGQRDLQRVRFRLAD